MKEFKTYKNKIIAETDKKIIDLALESNIFRIEKGKEDFKYSLEYYRSDINIYNHCWGLNKKMTLKEALKDFEYLEEQLIKIILDELDINYKIKWL